MSNGVRMPKDYHRKARERKRDANIRLAAALGYRSRHLENPEGSERWLETGRWDDAR